MRIIIINSVFWGVFWWLLLGILAGCSYDKFFLSCDRLDRLVKALPSVHIKFPLIGPFGFIKWIRRHFVCKKCF